MKRANLFRRKDLLFVDSLSQTTTGLWTGTALHSLMADCSDQEIGHAVRHALSASRIGVEHPNSKDWQAIESALWSASGVKSWSEFVRGARSVRVDQDGRVFSLTPLRNAGARQGFVAIGEKTFGLPVTTADEQLGEAVRRAFEMAE